MERDVIGLIAEVLERDENGEYVLRDEVVFRSFFHAGASSGHDIRLLIEAGGEAMRGHIERDAAGRIREQALIRPNGTADA